MRRSTMIVIGGRLCYASDAMITNRKALQEWERMDARKRLSRLTLRRGLALYSDLFQLGTTGYEMRGELREAPQTSHFAAIPIPKGCTR